MNKPYIHRSLAVLSAVFVLLFIGYHIRQYFLRRDAPPPHMLKLATYVLIQSTGNTAGWEQVRQGRFFYPGQVVWQINLKDYPTMLSFLRQSGQFHTSLARSKSSFVLYIIASDGGSMPAHPYVYLPDTGELGSGREWCYVPPEFEAWFKTLSLKPNLIHVRQF